MDAIWILMFCTILLLPIILIVIGWIFKKYTPPYSKNAFFGYRTKMSKLNPETWEFAHKHFGKNSFVLGVIMLPISILSLLAYINADSETIAIVGTVVVSIQAVVFICAIFPTEKALKENFDEYGYRR